jgi:F-type H+-transporting ATPase subunit epsilon
MAEKLSFDLVSPDRLLVSAAVDMVVVPGAEGEFGVLPNHAPVISTMRPGVLQVEGGENGSERYFVRGGFAEVTPEGLTVLAEEAVPLSELDTAALDAQIRNAEEDVADAKDDERRAPAQEALDHLRQLKSAL